MLKYQTLILLTAFAGFAGLAAADGPENGLVQGQVTSAIGEPLPATVHLVTDRGTKSVVVGSDGAFRFTLVPPGEYPLRAELDGFKTAEASVEVTAGGKVEVGLELALETSETISVTAEAPMVDKFNVTAGATVLAEIGEETAGSTRTFYGVVNMLPGVTNDANNQDIQQTRPSVNGSHFADNSVFIDGVDTTFARLGGGRVFLPITATREITMEAGGSSAEYGRVVGSATNVIVKSGTNGYHGQFLGSHQETQWNGGYTAHPELEERESTPVNRDFFDRVPAEEEGDNTGLEFALGGPIVRDRTWFFAAWSEVNSHDLDKTLNNDVVDTSFEFSSRVAKLNFQPSDNHQLAVSWIDTPAERVYFHPTSGDQYTPTPHDLSGDLGSLNWNYSVSGEMFLETKIAVQTSNESKFLAVGGTDLAAATLIKQQDPRFAGDPALGPDAPVNNFDVYLDQADDDSWHNGWLLDNGFGVNQYPREQFNSALTWFASPDHEVKFGVDWQEVEWRSDVSHTNLYSGPGFNAQSSTGYDLCGLAFGAFCVFRNYTTPPGLVKGEGDTVGENTALYVRDRFSAGSRLTFNVGVRAERSRNENDVGRTVVDEINLAPRFVGTYDITNDGKMLASLNVGRYYTQLNQQFTNEWLLEEWNGYNAFDSFLFCSGFDAAIAAIPGNPFGMPPCHLTGVGYTMPFRSIRPGRMWELVDQGLFDSDIEPYYKDEAILGFEWQFSRNWALDAKAIYWELGDMIGNTVQVDPDGNFFELSANYKDWGSILRAIGQVPEDIIAGFEEGRKSYRAIQLQINRRPRNGWSLNHNLTLSKLETTGAGAWWNNTNSSYGENLGEVLTQAHIDACVALQVTRNVPMDCSASLTPMLGQPLSTIHRLGRDGLRPGIAGGTGVDRPLIWNSFGFKTWSFERQSFSLGGLFSFESGIPWARGEELQVVSPANGNNALLSETFVFLEPNGARRLDSFWQLNLSGAWGFPLGREGLEGKLRVEVLNVTNNQDQIDVTSRGEALRVRRGFQRPRQIRFAASLSF